MEESNQQADLEFSWSRVLFSFQGRIGRKLYWGVFGLRMAVIVAALMIDAGLSAPGGNLVLTPWVFLASVWPGLAAQVKRWHDHDRTGAWVLVNFLPGLGGLITFVVCGILKGTRGMNSYGPDPLMAAGSRTVTGGEAGPICHSCGTRLSMAARFCDNCGQAIQTD